MRVCDILGDLYLEPVVSDMAGPEERKQGPYTRSRGTVPEYSYTMPFPLKFRKQNK